MKKFFITLAILFTASLPVFSANWVTISLNKKDFLDTTSIIPYSLSSFNHQSDSLYSVWIKMLNKGTEDNKKLNAGFGKVYWYSKVQLIIDCSKKEYALKSYTFFDLNNVPISNRRAAETTPDNRLYWDSIIPETVLDTAFFYVCINNQNSKSRPRMKYSNPFTNYSNPYLY